MTVNKVILIGRVGKEPEIRVMNSGDKMATFSLATSEYWTDKQTGERREKTEWHRIVVYSKGMVGVVEKYVHKGKKLYVEGKLQTRKWVDKHGVEKYTTEIIIQGYNCLIAYLEKRTTTQQTLDSFDGSKKVEEKRETSVSFMPDDFVDDDGIEDEIPF